jgi:hypothetical protein
VTQSGSVDRQATAPAAVAESRATAMVETPGGRRRASSAGQTDATRSAMEPIAAKTAAAPMARSVTAAS